MTGKVRTETRLFLALNAIAAFANVACVATSGSALNAIGAAVCGAVVVVLTESAARQVWPDAPPSREGI